MVKTHPSYKLHRHQNLLHYNVIGAKKCCSVPLLSLVSEDFAWCKRCTWTQDDASPFKCHSTWFKHNSNVTGLLSTPFQPQALPSLLLPCHFEAWWSRRERSWRSNGFTQFFFLQASSGSKCLYDSCTNPKASCESCALLLWSSFTLFRSRCTSACLRSASWPWSIPLVAAQQKVRGMWECWRVVKATKPRSHESWRICIFEAQTKSSLIFLLPCHSLMVCTSNVNVQSECSSTRRSWIGPLTKGLAKGSEAKVTEKNTYPSGHIIVIRSWICIRSWYLGHRWPVSFARTRSISCKTAWCSCSTCALSTGSSANFKAAN